MINLGKSTRLGLPSEQTNFKTKGLYKFSRNPMYVCFKSITFSSIIYTFNIWIVSLGIYSVIVYHLIILGEEQFLENWFNNEFISYKTNLENIYKA